MKYLHMMLFLIVFLSVYFGINYYSLHRMLGFFSITKNIWPIALCLTIFYPLTAFTDRMFHSLPTRMLYYIGSTWLGFIFMLFFLLLLAEIINIFYNVFSQTIIGWTILILALIVTGFSLFNVSTVSIKEIAIDDFGSEIKIVQLSDIHVGTIRNSGYLEKIINIVNSIEPDIVVITGDLVDGSGKLTNLTFSQLKKIKSPVYFSMGNHEYYEGVANVRKLLSENNVGVLQNEFETIKGINIVGMDYSESREYVSEHLPKINFSRELPSILLNHVPLGYEAAQKQGIRLQLSGHTHNGQVFPFSLLVKLFFPKNSGLYDLNGFYLYVSPGTGTWGPPMRLGSRNEITVFNLK